MMVYTNTRFKHKKKRKVNPANIAKKLTKSQLDALYDPAPMPKYKTYDRSIPSLSTSAHNTERTESTKYTGTLVKGIATMHKSNAVPIIDEQQAIEVATMRRN